MAEILVVVPAYDEAASIGSVLKELRSAELRGHSLELLVVDDGSRDGTGDEAAGHGASVLRMPFNCGIGASVQAGLRYGLARGYELFARVDADGQHDPASLAALLRPIAAGEADWVLGSRYVRGEGFQSSPGRRLGIRWFSRLLRAVCGLEITDPTSGLWAANRRAASVLAEESAADYPEVDALLRLHAAGCRVSEVPVAMRARQSGRSSIRGLAAPYYMIKVTIGLLVARIQSPR